MIHDAENEKRAVDAMTHGMLSSALLLNFGEWVYSEKRERTLGDFYDGFNKTHASQRFRPFNEGVVLGYLYWLMFAKENWHTLVPDDDPSTWGIAPVRTVIPKRPGPTIKYLVRRIRNAMGHSAPTITAPVGVTPATMITSVTIAFHDVDPRDATDTFDVELTLKDAFELTRRIHQIVLNDVAQRHGVTPPTK